MPSRRNFLKILGGGVVLAAGGAGAFYGTRTPAKALAPWEAAGGYDEPRMRALSYAILAPNPHNRQPWMVDLSVADQVTIWRDKAKNLPETDPFDRQLTIGM
ncbi:MAG: twin-arginine translocation signal domain-containing protein, partial [Pseudomonadota bacterium]